MNRGGSGRGKPARSGPGGGRGGGRGRGSRGQSKESSSAVSISKEGFTESAHRAARFDGMAGNKYEELKSLRQEERQRAIDNGLIDDPDRPKSLNQALKFVGTCQDMCPLYEREQREYQNSLEKWEINPNTGRVDVSLAVKAYHRPAAGNEQALPSDVRPPMILNRTLDYLVDRIICGPDPLRATHFFVRDRTRSIRQDFTLQNIRGQEAIPAHERIARYHILCLHKLRGEKGFSEQQELEQLRKVLQSLQEFYEDCRKEGFTSPNEAEFRAYNIITHLRNLDTYRQTMQLPMSIFNSVEVQQAIRLVRLSQRSNERVANMLPANTEASLNFYTKLFKEIFSGRTSYLQACIMETHFFSIRKGALKAMRKSYLAAHNPIPLEAVQDLLYFDSEDEAVGILQSLGIEIQQDHPPSVLLNRATSLEESHVNTPFYVSSSLVETKRHDVAINDMINGTWPRKDTRSQSATETQRPLRSREPESGAFNAFGTFKKSEPERNETANVNIFFKPEAPRASASFLLPPQQISAPKPTTMSSAKFGSAPQPMFSPQESLRAPSAQLITPQHASQESKRAEDDRPTLPDKSKTSIRTEVSSDVIYKEFVTFLSRRIFKSLIREIMQEEAYDCFADNIYFKRLVRQSLRKLRDVCEERVHEREENERLIYEDLKQKRRHREMMRHLLGPKKGFKSIGTGPKFSPNYENDISRAITEAKKNAKLWASIPSDFYTEFSTKLVLPQEFNGVFRILVYADAVSESVYLWFQKKVGIPQGSTSRSFACGGNAITLDVSSLREHDDRVLEKADMGAMIFICALHDSQSIAHAQEAFRSLIVASESRVLNLVPLLMICLTETQTDFSLLASIFDLKSLYDDRSSPFSRIDILSLSDPEDTNIYRALKSQVRDWVYTPSPLARYKQVQEAQTCAKLAYESAKLTSPRMAMPMKRKKTHYGYIAAKSARHAEAAPAPSNGNHNSGSSSNNIARTDLSSEALSLSESLKRARQIISR